MNPGFTYCGFKYNGDCRDFAPPANGFACGTYDAATWTYSDCHDSASGDNGKWHKSTNYRQAITIYVSGV